MCRSGLREIPVAASVKGAKGMAYDEVREGGILNHAKDFADVTQDLGKATKGKEAKSILGYTLRSLLYVKNVICRVQGAELRGLLL